MTRDQAAELVARIATLYPNASFDTDNAAAYERELIRLDHARAAAAIDELIRTSPQLPTLADIHREITAAKREEARREGMHRPSPIVDADGRTMGPRPDGWKAPLDRMLEDAARYDRMARAWYASKGKPYPGDPGLGFVKLATAGARGDDIGSALQSALSSMVARADEDEVD